MTATEKLIFEKLTENGEYCDPPTNVVIMEIKQQIADYIVTITKFIKHPAVRKAFVLECLSEICSKIEKDEASTRYEDLIKEYWK